MKKNVGIVLALLFCPLIGYTQSDSSAESLIKKVVLNYIENFFENNYEQMNKSLHPRLAKRGLQPDGTLSKDYPPDELKILLSKKPKFENQYQHNVVKDIRVFGNMASASLYTGYPKSRWVEYIHLFFENDTWKIINVFWDFKKESKE